MTTPARPILTQDRAEADDSMQDTLERALVCRKQFLAGSNLGARPFSIKRNRFIEMVAGTPTAPACSSSRTSPAGQARCPHTSTPVPSPRTWPGRTGADEVACGETHQGPLDSLLTEDVDAGIATLVLAQREIFELAYRQRVSHRVIAGRLRVPIGTIGTRLFRGT